MPNINDALIRVFNNSDLDAIEREISELLASIGEHRNNTQMQVNATASSHKEGVGEKENLTISSKPDHEENLGENTPLRNRTGTRISEEAAPAPSLFIPIEKEEDMEQGSTSSDKEQKNEETGDIDLFTIDELLQPNTKTIIEAPAEIIE